MKRKLALSILSIIGLIAIGQEHISVVDKNNEPIAYFSAYICSADSVALTHVVGDLNGNAIIPATEGAQLLNIKCFGFTPYWCNLPANQKITLTEDVLNLSEVTVSAKRSLVKPLNSGFAYDMESNKFAQTNNLWQALKVVPLLDVDDSGTLKVAGTENATIYLNGKPYDIAQTNPMQVLQSLQASKVKTVEIITDPDERYGNMPGTNIINIITSEPIVNGYIINAGAGYSTKTTVDGKALLLATKGNVDFSASYNYGLTRHNDQPVYFNYYYPTDTIRYDSSGDGNWHSHTARGMMKWHIDTIQDLYFDIHANITPTDFLTTRHIIGDDHSNDRYSRNKNTSGVVESNLIYRRYFNDSPSKERFSLGYRFTYNPDKRNTYQQFSDSSWIEKTDGRLIEHTLNGNWRIPLARTQYFRVGARGILRDGETHSLNQPEADLDYNQTFALGNIMYYGRFNRVTLIGTLQAKYEHYTYSNSGNNFDEYGYNSFTFLPRANFYWSPTRVTQFKAGYSRTELTPSIEMLNPFVQTGDGISISRGNPDLKASRKDAFNIGFDYMGSPIMLFATLGYEYNKHIFLPFKESEDNLIVNTYENFGSRDQYSLQLNGSWRIKNNLQFQLSFYGGYSSLKAEEINLRQHDWFYHLFAFLFYNITDTWSARLTYGLTKQLPAPQSSINNYMTGKLEINKSWLNGRLTTGIVIDTPWEKYHHSTKDYWSDDFNMQQINYITARSFGINIAYSFNAGKSVRLDRDRTLLNDDLNTGVR